MGVNLYVLGCNNTILSVDIPEQPDNMAVQSATMGVISRVYGYIYIHGVAMTQGPVAMCIETDCHVQTLSSPWYYFDDAPTGHVQVKLKWPNDASGEYIVCGAGTIVVDVSTQIDCHI